jgi:hypothetical protein
MKALILLFILSPILGYSQLIFSETFNEGNGSTSGNDDVGGVSWSTTCPYSVASTDYFKIVNGVLEGRDTNGPAEFTTDEINTSSCSNTILIEMDLSQTSTMEIDGGCNSVDMIKLEYSTDGGSSWNVVSDILQGGTAVVETIIYSTAPCVDEDVIGPFIVVGGFSDFTYTACIYPTSSLKLKISVMNWADAEKYRIDNLKVSCSNCITPLPIELISFYVVNIDGVNRLKWETASELNNDYFIIENSVDGYSWNTIETPSGAGNSTEKITYYLEHRNYKETTNYYRLTQVDFDGKREVFKTIAIDNSKENKILVRSVNLMGQEVDEYYRGFIINLYSDGTTDKELK